MVPYLQNQGGALDFADTKTLLAERDREWDASKVPQIYFNRVEKAIQGLTQADITSNLTKRRDMALYYLKASGEFDAAVREWEARPTGQKTWQNIKTFISTEYVKENKQNKLTAKNFKENMIEELAKAKDKLIAALTKNHTCQMETLIKSTTNAMKDWCPSSRMSRKHPKTNQIMRERRNKTKGARHIMKHLSVSTAERNQKMSVGSWRKTKTPAHPIGSHQKAPEGVWGPC
jgi:hypothetical protein